MLGLCSYRPWCLGCRCYNVMMLQDTNIASMFSSPRDIRFSSAEDLLVAVALSLGLVMIAIHFPISRSPCLIYVALWSGCCPTFSYFIVTMRASTCSISVEIAQWHPFQVPPMGNAYIDSYHLLDMPQIVSSGVHELFFCLPFLSGHNRFYKFWKAYKVTTKSNYLACYPHTSHC